MHVFHPVTYHVTSFREILYLKYDQGHLKPSLQNCKICTSGQCKYALVKTLKYCISRKENGYISNSHT